MPTIITADAAKTQNEVRSTPPAGPLYLGRYRTGPNDLDHQGIYEGDARRLALVIPPASVDLVFADPMYTHLPDYAWLGRTAALVLKPEGHLLVWGAATRVNEYTRLLDPFLHFRCELTFVQWGVGGTPMGRHGRFVLKTTPCLWYSKAADSWPHECVWSVSTTTTLVNIPRHHRYNKDPNTVARWINGFCPRDGVVLDPFCGGGVVPVAAKALGRAYVAFDRDAEAVQEARCRVRAVAAQPQLEVKEPGGVVQRALFEEESV